MMVACDAGLSKLLPSVALTKGQGHSDFEKRPKFGMIVTEGHNDNDCDSDLVTVTSTKGYHYLDCDRRS